MAKKMETKSARILALILALIMVGSVLVYAFKGSTTVSEREIKFDMGNFSNCMNYLPYGAQFVLYLSFKGLNEESDLYTLVHNAFKSNIDPYTFNHIAFPNRVGIESIIIAEYPYPLYFVNVNKSKVFFAYEGQEEYKGYKIKLRQGAALLDQTSPFVLGYPTLVYGVVDLITQNNASVGEYTYNYTTRIYNFTKADFNYAFMLYGDFAKDKITSNNTSVGDFYFAGFRMNGSVYEKVVAIHFTKNGFFVSTNETKNNTVYYYYQNYEDGLSIAKIGDYNLTKLFETNPEMRIVEIKMEK
ncbi:hypothetical protein DRP05_01665 [Archaeoglobales archaeon]|nr:MAG: hypothetical protein DRP05_01665 [Archaeoglobales archaeon]